MPVVVPNRTLVDGVRNDAAHTDNLRSDPVINRSRS